MCSTCMQAKKVYNPSCSQVLEFLLYTYLMHQQATTVKAARYVSHSHEKALWDRELTFSEMEVLGTLRNYTSVTDLPKFS